MVALVIIAAWWLSGVLGGILLWRDWAHKFPEGCGPRPTRAGALAIAVVGVLGLLILAAGVLIVVIGYFGGRPANPANPDSWWRKQL